MEDIVFIKSEIEELKNQLTALKFKIDDVDWKLDMIIKQFESN